MMNKIRTEVEDGMKLIWKKVDPKDLKPGDHIYAYKRYGSYSHHGIYVGDGYVIHFTRTEIKEAILPFSRVEPETVPPCPECGYQENTGRGVIKTCLNCFRRGHKKLHSIHYFMYGVPQVGLLLKKSGTCSTLSCTRSPGQVVEVAYELLKSNGFGKYDLTSKNCEHFATYCKTGVPASVQTAFYERLMKFGK
ncbi:protein LEAD-SENSITIVE 1-like [Rhodamnia argentea]|uniref:Protein LEAD-SENSITIVE 1-like n=1 Tax=Rhodamnia argentea TaxID=178133 RepID=A0A8B8PJV0_9MYRT|nr:protein LEAD-SENSITIVE 1-like [Rhodamnia argentea]